MGDNPIACRSCVFVIFIWALVVIGSIPIALPTKDQRNPREETSRASIPEVQGRGVPWIGTL